MNRQLRARSLLVLLPTISLLFSLTSPAFAAPTGWTPTGSLRDGRAYHTATRLSDGRILVAGGLGSAGYLASAEIYDPATGTWTPTGSMATVRETQTA